MKRIAVILTALMLTVGVVLSIASASVGNIEKSLLYNDIKITLDGEEIKPADVNGNYIEPFIIEGTTYLPVRGIASSLGLTVGWDGDTNTVKLNEPLNETVDLYDKNKIKISFKKYEYTAEGDLKLRLYVENGSADGVELYVHGIIINGNMLDASFRADFASRKKDNADIVIKAQRLKDSSITYIKEIELITDVTDASTGERIMDSGVITVTPESAVLAERSDDKDDENRYADIKHQDFVDFIKANGVPEEGTYKVIYSFFVREYKEQRPTLFVMSMSCGDEDNEILLSTLMQEESTTGINAHTYLDMTLAPDKSSHSFEAEMPNYSWKITGSAAADKTMLTPEGLTIQQIKDAYYNFGGFAASATISDGQTKDVVAMHLSDMLKLIAENGNGLFEKYDSELSLGFFGIEK